MLKLCKNWNKIAFLTRIMLKNGNNEYFLPVKIMFKQTRMAKIVGIDKNFRRVVCISKEKSNTIPLSYFTYDKIMRWNYK